jgi:DNA-3-methyladenine glycosylase II
MISMPNRLFCTVPLPASFRPGNVLAFHRRDPQASAERVSDNGLQKGLLWDDFPACLALRFQADRAEAELIVDGVAAGDSPDILAAMVRRMLGLSQDIESFENSYGDHPQLGALIARQRGLRVPVAATPFEALTWAVTGQQISVGAAVAIRRRLILATGRRHSTGLLCYPDAGLVAELSEEDLRQAGFSASKTRTLRTLSQQVVAGQLPLDDWTTTLPVAEIREKLLAVPGIGPWTVNYTLLRGYGWLDGSLHGDVAVRRGLQGVLGKNEKIGEDEAKAWLAGFSPWRALVAAHLWAAKSSAIY